MNSEREIVMKLREAKELDESSFESGGKTYKCAFGKYYCDGEQISRDEYFKAQDGSSSPTSSRDPEASKDEPKKLEKKSYDQYSEDELEEELLTIEDSIEEIKSHIGDAGTYDERNDYEDALDDLTYKLQGMDEYLTDEQWERAEKLQDLARHLKDTEYNGEKIDPYEYNGVRREDFY